MQTAKEVLEASSIGSTQCTIRKCIKALQSLCRNIVLCKRPANHPPQSLPLADHIVACIRPINVTRVLTPFKRNQLSPSLPLSLSNRISFDACPTQSCACMRGTPMHRFHLIRFHSAFWVTGITFTFCEDRHELMCCPSIIRHALYTIFQRD